MANLDKLLKRIEKNKETAEEVKTFPLTIASETFEVKTMTRREKREFFYAQEAGKTNFTAGDLIKKMKPFIYKALDLKELAVKAKEQELITSYYDVVEALFEPDEILEIINFIVEINNISATNAESELDDIKKQ